MWPLGVERWLLGALRRWTTPTWRAWADGRPAAWRDAWLGARGRGRWCVSGELIKPAAKIDWYDGRPDSCQIVESEVVWRATALVGLRSFRLSVLTACARR